MSAIHLKFSKLLLRFGLAPLSSGHSNAYSLETDPSTLNEFAVAARQVIIVTERDMIILQR